MNGLSDNGYNGLPIRELKRLVDLFDYGSGYRVYLLLLTASAGRPTELEDLRWSNVNGNKIIFKPKKANHNKRIVRIVRIGSLLLKELMNYRKRTSIINDRVFNFSYYSFKKQFDKKFRRLLGGNWNKKIVYKINSSVKERYIYTIRSIRTTIGTLAFMFLARKYSEMVALSRVSKWMGHQSQRITLDFYIKHLDELEINPKILDKFYFFDDLIDFIIYKDKQEKLSSFFAKKETQKKLIEYGEDTIFIQI